eukprot:CAMPEP_0114264416 /NCGR_PEP_ID=MMETSP0058-20121206/23188_1 /TAXON_ID=36894 /ORGANISM="Pyramimonas parkeae, CCMP726" /LENGTH=98 /DNA_ID=CAMNT_0001381075 /DNA_START=68 /DNA_END=364 /DNA_ORIENTATION=+
MPMFKLPSLHVAAAVRMLAHHCGNSSASSGLSPSACGGRVYVPPTDKGRTRVCLCPTWYAHEMISLSGVHVMTLLWRPITSTTMLRVGLSTGLAASCS